MTLNPVGFLFSSLAVAFSFASYTIYNDCSIDELKLLQNTFDLLSKTSLEQSQIISELTLNTQAQLLEAVKAHENTKKSCEDLVCTLDNVLELSTNTDIILHNTALQLGNAVTLNDSIASINKAFTVDSICSSFIQDTIDSIKAI